MRFRITILIKAIFFAIVLSVVSGMAILYSMDLNVFKNKIESQIFRATGRPFHIQGDLTWNLFSFHPSIMLHDAHFLNIKGGTKEDMIVIEKLEAVLDLRQTFNRKVTFNRFILISPEIFLEKKDKDTVNWDIKFNTKKQEEEKEEKVEESQETFFSFDLGFEEIDIQDGQFIFLDQTKNETTTLKVTQASVQTENMDSPIKLNLDATFNNIRYTLSAKAGSLNQVLNQTAPYPIAATLNMAHVQLNAKGAVEDIQYFKNYKFDASLSIPALLQTVQMLGGGDTLPFPSLTAEMNISDTTAGEIKLDNINVKMGDSDAKGSIKIVPNGKPILYASLSSSKLNINEWIPKKENPTPVTQMFPDVPLLPNALLKAVNLYADLSVGVLNIPGKINLYNVQTNAKLVNGTLNLSPVKATYAQIPILGTARFQSYANKNLSANIDLETSSGKLKNIIKIYSNKDIVDGGDIAAKVHTQATGKTIKQMMAHLNGNIQLTGDQISSQGLGEYLFGADFVSSLFKSEERMSRASIQCAVANMNFTDGIATLDRQIAIESKKVNIVGSGQLNFKTEEMELSFIPTAQGGLGVGAGTFASMIKIKGPILHPKTKFDANEMTAEIATTAATTAATALATGGLSLAAAGIGLLGQKLFKSATEDSHPCQTALGITQKDISENGKEEKDGSLKETIQNSVKETFDKTKEKTQKAVDKIKEETVDKVTNGLEKLF